MKNNYHLFCPKYWVVFLTSIFIATSFALTPNERTMVRKIQTEVREGQSQYAEAQRNLAKAQADTTAADSNAAKTATQLDVAQKTIDQINKDNARMKPVYDQCVKWWGIGAIEFGVKRLIRNLLLTAAILGAVLLGLYIASFFFPIIGLGLAIVLRVFRRGFTAVGAIIKRVVMAIEAHLLPKPKYEGS